MQSKQLAYFQHDVGAGCKLVKATEFTADDPAVPNGAFWRVTVTQGEQTNDYAPLSRAEAISMAQDWIGTFVKELAKLYHKPHLEAAAGAFRLTQGG